MNSEIGEISGPDGLHVRNQVALDYYKQLVVMSHTCDKECVVYIATDFYYEYFKPFYVDVIFKIIIMIPFAVTHFLQLPRTYDYCSSLLDHKIPQLIKITLTS